MKKLQLLFILFHTSLFLLLYFANLIVFRVSDDSSLYTLLKAGYSGTLILSYPTSWLLSSLYQWFPSIQWLSLFYFTLVFINLIIFYYYIIKNTENKFSRILLILLSILLYTYIWQNITITTITLLTYVSAIMLYRYNIKGAFFFIFLSLFLRIDIVILCLPFIILSMILLNYSILIKWKIYYYFLL